MIRAKRQAACWWTDLGGCTRICVSRWWSVATFGAAIACRKTGFVGLPWQGCFRGTKWSGLRVFFVQQGITKIRLTGGEPLLRHDVTEIAEAIGSLPGLHTLAVTTNGLLLAQEA